MRNISRKALILSAISTLLALPEPTAAQGSVVALSGPDFDYLGCAVYEHSDFQGASRGFVSGADLSYVGDDWNDTISSLACHPRCSLTIYEHVDYQGARFRLVGAISYVGDAWNDQISGLSVRCN